MLAELERASRELLFNPTSADQSISTRRDYHVLPLDKPLGED